MNKRLKIARILAEKTQIQLSQETGLSRDYISELERGVNKNPSLDVMIKISKALNVSVQEIFLYDE